MSFMLLSNIPPNTLPLTNWINCYVTLPNKRHPDPVWTLSGRQVHSLWCNDQINHQILINPESPYIARKSSLFQSMAQLGLIQRISNFDPPNERLIVARLGTTVQWVAASHWRVPRTVASTFCNWNCRQKVLEQWHVSNCRIPSCMLGKRRVLHTFRKLFSLFELFERLSRRVSS